MLSRKAGFVEKTVDLLIRIRWPLLLAAIVLTAVAWPEAQELSLNRTMENTLPEGNPYREAYEKSRRIFGTRDSVIVAYPEPHVFQKGSLRLTDEAPEHAATREEAATGSGGRAGQCLRLGPGAQTELPPRATGGDARGHAPRVRP